MEPNDVLKLSDEAVIFLNECIAPIVTQDYIGWVVPLPKRFKSVFIVDYSEDKYWNILHKNVNKKLSKRQIVKSLKYLQKQGWLHPYYLEPFEEFSPRLKISMNNVILIPKEREIPFSDTVNPFPEIAITYDDDISGITVLDEEDKK